MSLLRALRHRNFALVFWGQSLSRLGDFVFNLALAWWVLEKTGSALAIGAVMVFGALPMLFFLLIGGVLVDRLNRAWLLFFSDMGRGGLLLMGTWLLRIDRLEIWMVYVGALIFSFADAFFMPAYTALVPQLTPRDDWPSANSLSSLSMQLSRVLGPALGGLLVGLGGTTLAFEINAVSFIFSGLLLIPLLSLKPVASPAPEASDMLKPAPAPNASFLAEIREGWKIVFAQPILWITILTSGVTNILLAGPFSVGLPFLVKDFMGGDEKLLGLLLAIFPIGYILTSLALGNLKRLRWRGPIVFLGGSIAALGLAVFGLRLPLWLLIVAALINGAALEGVGLAWTNLLQEMVPVDKLGRVSSIDMLGSFVLLPIGFALTGWAVETIGPALTFVIGGGLGAILSAVPLLLPAIRQTD